MSMVRLGIISRGRRIWQISEHRPIEMITITLIIISFFTVFVKAFSPLACATEEFHKALRIVWDKSAGPTNYSLPKQDGVDIFQPHLLNGSNPTIYCVY